ncbi:uncharacterized protein CEXT_675711 [Caerostris extrusa]|uniref:Uncharacterized protein n=1 Tax=Caerostris extrusa TaxID=172846 RepID=A0AAV4QMC1_CAEEX|nr:uncharacterized protein CEXT_675711 [Caerostris extrusa]
MNISSPTNLMKSQLSPTYNSDIGYNRSDDFAHLPGRYEHMQTEYLKFENELIASKSHSNMNEITSSQVSSSNVTHSKPTSILVESEPKKLQPSATNPNSPVDELIEPTNRKLKSSAEEKNIKKLLETSKNCSLSRSINSPSEWSKSDSISFLSGSFDESVPSPIDINSTDISPQQSLSQRCASAISSQKPVVCLGGRQEPESVLEHAIATLESNEPISAVVGLDYIIEYKSDLRMGGKFPFRCTLCISQIPKASILDHVFGLSHRLRYLKIKDDFTYDQIRQADQDNDKDKLINEAIEKLEQEYGRGHVIVSLDSSLKGVRKSSFGNIYKAHLEHESIEFECSRKTIKNTIADAKNRDNIFTETSASKLQKKYNLLDKSVEKQYLEVECIDISEDSIPNEDIVQVQIFSKATQTDEADAFIPSLLDQLLCAIIHSIGHYSTY